MAQFAARQASFPGFLPDPATAPPAANDGAAPAARPDRPVGPRSRRLVIACPAELAEAARNAEMRSGRTLSQLVNSLLHALPPAAVEQLADFNEPLGRRRRGANRVLIRAAARWSRPAIRRAIGFVCGIDSGALRIVDAPEQAALLRELEDGRARIAQLLDFLERLSFRPLPEGIRSREDALYVLGLPPSGAPDMESLIARFRSLAPIFHPDSGLAETHLRMVQLLEARRYLATWR